MYYFWTAILGALALLWILQAGRMFLGMSKLPRLEGASAPPDDSWPSVSVLVAARNEAAGLRAALPTLLAQDYPRFEVIVADDRSSDATPQILDEFSRRHPTLKVVRIAELPEGWLGKPHALSAAYEHARGEWLLFTDADVRLKPDVLRRAVSLAAKMGFDHLTLLPKLDADRFWERTATAYHALGFVLGFKPWRVSDPESPSYLGIGAFQLLSRSAYEAIGGHRRLAMEIADDTKLGKLVKHAGFRSGVALGKDKVRVRWHVGLGNFIRGISKNFFAACGFRVGGAMRVLLQIVAFSLAPFVAAVLYPGAARAFALASIAAALACHAWVARQLGLPAVYALTHPLGGLIFCYICVRSTVLTFWRGGVTWRETFYPLAELRRGMV